MSCAAMLFKTEEPGFKIQSTYILINFLIS